MNATQAAKTNVGRDDEQAIRDLVNNFIEASKRQDLTTLLSMLDDDVLFITQDREPFGKQEFAAANSEKIDVKMDAAIDIKEIKVLGEWAWMRSFLEVSFTKPGRDATTLSGHILTILRKTDEGKWVIHRDANFVKPR